jgi:hypothetical protein
VGERGKGAKTKKHGDGLLVGDAFGEALDLVLETGGCGGEELDGKGWGSNGGSQEGGTFFDFGLGAVEQGWFGG